MLNTDEAVHLCGIYRIWWSPVGHVEYCKGTVFFEWRSVIAQFVKKNAQRPDIFTKMSLSVKCAVMLAWLISAHQISRLLAAEDIHQPSLVHDIEASYADSNRVREPSVLPPWMAHE